MGAYGGPNAEAIEAWDTVLFEKFTRFRQTAGQGLGVHGDAAIERLALRPGAHVLDVGCGFGDTTRQLAQRVGTTGEVVGVDGSSNFIQAASEEAKAAGLTNARFGVLDVQCDDLSGPWDIVFARFGTMFFASAVQALRNIQRSLAPGGRLCMVVWRRREDNLWLYTPEQVVRELVPDRHDERGDAVTYGPGPFSMADADLVGDQLVKAGFEHIKFERFDANILIGQDLEDAIEFAMALGPAGEIMRRAGDIGERKMPEVVETLKKAFVPLLAVDGMVRAPSSTWIITATPKVSRASRPDR
jgi:ubiquinone/menaquinone biosynthesis C-methylase UbiE